VTTPPNLADDDAGLTAFQRKGITAAILVIVGLQAVTGLKLVCPPRVLGDVEALRVACPPSLWPFTDYPMYEASYGPGSILPSYAVVLELADGSRASLAPADLDMTSRRFRREVIDRLLREQRGAVQRLAQRLLDESGRRVAAFVVENTPKRMDPDRFVDLPVEQTLRIELDEQGRMR